MTRFSWAALVGALLVVVSAPRGECATVMLSPAADAAIFQSGVNNGSGAGNGLYVGTNAQNSPRRALIRFDVAGGLPAGAVIQSVSLSAILGQVANGSAPPMTIGLHPVGASWGEGTTQKSTPATDSLGGQGQGAAAAAGDVTWSSRFHSSSLWTTAGGDFNPTASSALAVGTTVNASSAWPSTPSLVSDVQAWLNNPATNFGWLLKGDESTSSTARTFFSRDVATAGLRPVLTVTYAVPEPSGLTAVAWIAVAIIRRRRNEFNHGGHGGHGATCEDQKSLGVLCALSG